MQLYHSLILFDFCVLSTVAEISSSVYWRSPFNSLCTARNLTEFVVMDINDADIKYFTGQGQISHKVYIFSHLLHVVGLLVSAKVFFIYTI